MNLSHQAYDFELRKSVFRSLAEVGLQKGDVTEGIYAWVSRGGWKTIFLALFLGRNCFTITDWCVFCCDDSTTAHGRGTGCWSYLRDSGWRSIHSQRGSRCGWHVVRTDLQPSWVWLEYWHPVDIPFWGWWFNSTVPEVIAARHVGLRVLTLSLVTNVVIDTPYRRAEDFVELEAKSSSSNPNSTVELAWQEETANHDEVRHTSHHLCSLDFIPEILYSTPLAFQVLEIGRKKAADVLKIVTYVANDARWKS